MPTFSFCGSLFQTIELEFAHEIEAETQEQAANQFEELMASRRHGMEVDLNQVDKPFNMSGKYKVFDKPVDEINNIFDDDEAVASDVEFDGPF
ncbi:hypothetical protein OAO37_02725 [Planktomarina temperata]|nr:hypothetical protein [Planktomarina temperata]